MPGFDQTGPEGKGPLTGGRRGKCTTSTSEKKDTSQVTTPNEKEEVVYGVGRGGRPYGGGRGKCYGGGRRRRGFGRWQENGNE